jgi:hypothetical protein
MANPVGKPLTFKTVKAMQDCIDEYFDWCDNRIKNIHTKEGDDVAITHPAPYTMSGLARRLGLSRQALMEYSHRDKYGDAIKAARERIQEDVETRLMETSNQTGAIFNLKNNFGWIDKQQQDLTTNGKDLPTPILGAASGLPAHDSDEEAS